MNYNHIEFDDLQKQFNEGGAFETTLFNEDGSKENVKITNVSDGIITYENKQGETLTITEVELDKLPLVYQRMVKH